MNKDTLNKIISQKKVNSDVKRKKRKKDFYNSSHDFN